MLKPHLEKLLDLMSFSCGEPSAVCLVPELASLGLAINPGHVVVPKLPTHHSMIRSPATVPVALVTV